MRVVIFSFLRMPAKEFLFLKTENNSRVIVVETSKSRQNLPFQKKNRIFNIDVPCSSNGSHKLR